MIIIGATNELWIVMGIGIAFVAVGFYGAPVAWSVYGSARPVRRVVHAVTVEHLYTVQEIAAQLSLNEKDVRAHLDKCFNKNFLVGYKREGDNIVLNENIAADKREHFYECPYCGAKFTYTADSARCPYCGSPVKKLCNSTNFDMLRRCLRAAPQHCFIAKFIRQELRLFSQMSKRQ